MTTLMVVVAGLTAAGLVTAVARGWVLSRREAHPDHDPLRVLSVQFRLSFLAAELARIESDRDLYARAHHYYAVRAAYDALLREACDLAGLDPGLPVLRAGALDDPEERLREELELSSRGWTW